MRGQWVLQVAEIRPDRRRGVRGPEPGHHTADRQPRSGGQHDRGAVRAQPQRTRHRLAGRLADRLQLADRRAGDSVRTGPQHHHDLDAHHQNHRDGPVQLLALRLHRRHRVRGHRQPGLVAVHRGGELHHHQLHRRPGIQTRLPVLRQGEGQRHRVPGAGLRALCADRPCAQLGHGPYPRHP